MSDPDWLGFVREGRAERRGMWGVQIPDDDGGFVIMDEIGGRHENGAGWAEQWECLPIDEVPDRILRGSLCAVFVNACAALGVTFSCPLCLAPSSFPGVECRACAARPDPRAGEKA